MPNPSPTQPPLPPGQDHLDTYMQWECKQPITLYDASFPHKMAMYGSFEIPKF